MSQTRLLPLAAGLALAASPLVASDLPAPAPSTATPPPPAAEVVTDLDALTVVGDGFTPGSAGDRSGYNASTLLAEDAQNATRTFSFLDTASLRILGINTLDEATVRIAGASAPTRYGNQTVPTLRGDAAEIYTNGQRRSGSLYGSKLSFNSLEALEVLHGPGSVVQGPGKQTGGLVNAVTKQAHTGLDRTQVSARLGSWLPDGASFLNSDWTLDVNRSLGADQALRFSYMGQENDTLYRRNNGRDDFQDFYAAYRWNLSPSTTLDVLGQYVWAANEQLLGVNRPSQELIDHGRYVTGFADPTRKGYDDPDFGYSPGILNPADGDRKSLDITDTLLSDDDYANQNTVFAQGILKSELGPELDWTNRLFVDHGSRRIFHEFFYAERNTQYSGELRSELTWKSDAGGLPASLTTGGALRYEQREGFVNYWNEYAYAFDITAGRNHSVVDRYPNAFTPGGVIGPGGLPYHTPVDPYYATPETVRSRTWNPALFLKYEVQVLPSLALGYGLRGDAYWAHAEDPLPPAGGPQAKDSLDTTSGGGDVSLRWTPSAQTTLYATVARTSALNSNTVGDGINLDYDATTGAASIDAADFKTKSLLLELGLRQRLSETVWLGLTGYQQDRQRQGIGGSDDIIVRGAELETDWRPDDNWTVFLTGAYTRARYDDSAPWEFGGASLGDFYELGTGPGGIGNGQGLWSTSLAPGDYQVPGISEWSGSAGVTRHWDFGLSLSTWGTLAGPQAGNLLEEYTIPTQFELNASIAWAYQSWTVAVDALNLTNERNWIHNGDAWFDNQVLAINLPRRLELRVGKTF